MGLDRFAEAKAIRQKEVGLKLDAVGEHVDLYLLAFLEGDKAAMQREVDWTKGKPDEFVMLETEAEATAASGRIQQARELYRQAVDSAQQAKLPESFAKVRPDAQSASPKSIQPQPARFDQLFARRLGLS